MKEANIFLGHHIYQNLHNLIGAEATIILAKKFNGDHLYLPRTRDVVQMLEALSPVSQEPASNDPSGQESDSQGQRDQ